MTDLPPKEVVQYAFNIDYMDYLGTVFICKDCGAVFVSVEDARRHYVACKRGGLKRARGKS
ncbi:MAG: hypothetical protein DRJ47_06685 [Thermoprotei archaeon]|nr:MAG: hypothetical protein DRJ47_06685 [Thermoprotei archaeon]